MIIFGHSDNLIEIDGVLSEEIFCYDEEEPHYLAFSNGVVISIRHDSGEWKINQHTAPDDCTIEISSIGSVDVEKFNDYTDTCVIRSTKPITHVIVGKYFFRKHR